MARTVWGRDIYERDDKISVASSYSDGWLMNHFLFEYVMSAQNLLNVHKAEDLSEIFDPHGVEIAILMGSGELVNFIANYLYNRYHFPENTSHDGSPHCHGTAPKNRTHNRKSTGSAKKKPVSGRLASQQRQAHPLQIGRHGTVQGYQGVSDVDAKEICQAKAVKRLQKEQQPAHNYQGITGVAYRGRSESHGRENLGIALQPKDMPFMEPTTHSPPQPAGYSIWNEQLAARVHLEACHEAYHRSMVSQQALSPAYDPRFDYIN